MRKYRDFDALVRAAEGGDPSAAYALGLATRFGDENYPQESIGWLRRAAELGHAAAQYELGLAYAVGGSLEEDPAQAASWYERAANQGHAAAQGKLGFMYATGQGVPKDARQAEYWYRAAAKQQHPSGLYEISLSDVEADDELQGSGCEVGDSEFISLCKQAAEVGHAPAQQALAECYERGLCGIEENRVAARSWMVKAAAQGEPDAQRCLGVMLLQEGEPKSALPLLLRAANYGFADAQFQLGRMYRFGHGVEKDHHQAAHWYSKAAAQDYRPAQGEFDRLAREIEEDSGSGAEELADEAQHKYGAIKRKDTEAANADIRRRLQSLGYSFEGRYAFSPSGGKTYIASSFDLWDLMEQASAQGAPKAEIEHLAAHSLKKIRATARITKLKHQASILKSAEADAIALEAVKEASGLFLDDALKAAAQGEHRLAQSPKWEPLTGLLYVAGFYNLHKPGPAEQQFIDTVAKFIKALAVLVRQNETHAKRLAEFVPHLTDLEGHFLPYLHMGSDGYRELHHQWQVMKRSLRSAMNNCDSDAAHSLVPIYRKMAVIAGLFDSSWYKNARVEVRNRDSKRGRNDESCWSWKHASWKRFPMEKVISPGFFNWLSSPHGRSVVSALVATLQGMAERGAAKAVMRLQVAEGEDRKLGRHIAHRLLCGGITVNRFPLTKSVLAEFLSLRGFTVKLDSPTTDEITIAWS